MNRPLCAPLTERAKFEINGETYCSTSSSAPTAGNDTITWMKAIQMHARKLSAKKRRALNRSEFELFWMFRGPLDND